VGIGAIYPPLDMSRNEKPVNYCKKFCGRVASH
jgi:hypothetical protein